MSRVRSFSHACLVLLLLGACATSRTGSAITPPLIQITFVEGGDGPSFYLMSFRGENIHFQPVGQRDREKRLPHEEATKLAKFLRDSKNELEQMKADYPTPESPFFVISYGGRDVTIRADHVPMELRPLLRELDLAFSAFSDYYQFLSVRAD